MDKIRRPEKISTSNCFSFYYDTLHAYFFSYQYHYISLIPALFRNNHPDGCYLGDFQFQNQRSHGSCYSRHIWSKSIFRSKISLALFSPYPTSLVQTQIKSAHLVGAFWRSHFDLYLHADSPHCFWLAKSKIIIFQSFFADPETTKPLLVNLFPKNPATFSLKKTTLNKQSATKENLTVWFFRPS